MIAAANPDTTNGVGTSVAEGNGAKGSWVQLIASTPKHGHGLLVSCSLGGTGGPHAFDIGIGAAGSEVVIIADLISLAVLTNGGMHTAYFPLSLPAGTRIAARARASAASNNIFPLVHVVSGALAGLSSFGRCTTYGVSGVTPTAPANGSGWTQVVASTANQISALVLGLALSSSKVGLMDLAVGAAASEQMFLESIAVVGDTTPHYIGPLPVNIPAGSRISARAWATAGGGSSQKLALYGLD